MWYLAFLFGVAIEVMITLSGLCRWPWGTGRLTDSGRYTQTDSHLPLRETIGREQNIGEVPDVLLDADTHKRASRNRGT